MMNIKRKLSLILVAALVLTVVPVATLLVKADDTNMVDNLYDDSYTNRWIFEFKDLEDASPDYYLPTGWLTGITPGGLSVTAVQVGEIQTPIEDGDAFVTGSKIQLEGTVNQTNGTSGTFQIRFNKTVPGSNDPETRTITFNWVITIRGDGSSSEDPPTHSESSSTTSYYEEDTYYHLIDASAGEGGSISPAGLVEVEEWKNKTFVITPEPGYVIDKVLVDYDDVGAVSRYTFESVSREHVIRATFVQAEEPQPNPPTGAAV